MLQRYQSLARFTALSLFVAGLAGTAYGFYKLIGYQHDPNVWRYGLRLPALFVTLTILIACVGIWRGPDQALLAVGGVLVVVLGNVVPAAVVCVIGLSTLLLGRMVLRGRPCDSSESLLVGAVVLGVVLGLLVPFPINNRGTWGAILAIPLIIGRTGWSVRTLWPAATTFKPFSHLYLLKCAIGAAIIIHTLVGLMPETGHDALSMHLFVPAYVTHNQLWDYNVKLYSWAVMPKLVNWIYTAGYLFGGETSARLINVGSVILLAILTRRLSRWAGASELGSNWGLLLFLLTPLTYLETSSLFVEGMWSAFVLGGTIAILRLVTDSEDRKRDLLLAAILLGGAMSAKAVTSTHLPMLLMLLFSRPFRWIGNNLTRTAITSILLFLLIGMMPYLTAGWLTGNPLFPFFNGYFNSPYYPPENFAPPAMFDRGFRIDTIFRMTFNSSQFLEGTVGAAGFQWLLIIVPGLCVTAFLRNRRALLTGLICFSWLVLTFSQTAYLRYVFPGFALASVVAAVTITLTRTMGRRVSFCCLAVSCIALLLNLTHLDAATYYGYINPKVIISEESRDEYLSKVVPVRSMVRIVNEINQNEQPVMFLSSPLTAGLKADAQYVNWYNPRLGELVRAAVTRDDLKRVFSEERTAYVVGDDSYLTPVLRKMINELCDEVARVGSVTLYRVNFKSD